MCYCLSNDGEPTKENSANVEASLIDSVGKEIVGKKGGRLG